MSLTEEETKQILENWRLICSNTSRKKGFSVDFFMKLFELHPDYKGLFLFMPDESERELRQDPRVRAHCSRFINAFEAILDQLDDGSCLVSMLKTVVQSHSHYGVNGEIFAVAMGFFKQHLLNALGSEAHAEAWDKLLTVASKVIAEEANLIEQQEAEKKAMSQCQCFPSRG